MRHLIWIFVLAGFAGCASPKAVVTQATPVPALPAHAERKAMETRYEVRGYREAGNAAIRHEPHAIYRRTLVPTNAEASDTVPRTAFAPASVTPLPASEELNAELAKQKTITAEMLGMQREMADTQSKMQGQYALLVQQSNEAMRLRARMDAERARASANSATPSEGLTANGAPQTSPTKW
jgi:hypothetical protein